MTIIANRVPKFLLKPRYIVVTGGEGVDTCAGKKEREIAVSIYEKICDKWTLFIGFVDIIEMSFTKRNQNDAMTLRIATTLGEEHLRFSAPKIETTTVLLMPAHDDFVDDVAECWASDVRHKLQSVMAHADMVFTRWLGHLEPEAKK